MYTRFGKIWGESKIARNQNKQHFKIKKNTVLIKNEKEKDWLDKKTMHESDC